jgi:hypothetical protein
MPPALWTGECEEFAATFVSRALVLHHGKSFFISSVLAEQGSAVADKGRCAEARRTIMDRLSVLANSV